MPPASQQGAQVCTKPLHLHPSPTRTHLLIVLSSAPPARPPLLPSLPLSVHCSLLRFAHASLAPLAAQGWNYMRVARTGSDYESTTAKVLEFKTADKNGYDTAISTITGWAAGNVVLGAVAMKMKDVRSDFGDSIGNLLQKQPSPGNVVEKGPFNVVGIRKFSGSNTGTTWQTISRSTSAKCTEIKAVIPMSEITNSNGNDGTSAMCTSCTKGRFQGVNNKAYTTYGSLCTKCPQARCVDE